MLVTLRRAGVPVLWAAEVTEVVRAETLPLPLWEGVGGRGRSGVGADRPLPPTPSHKGRGSALAVHISGTNGDQAFDVDVVALNLGFQPEVGLARALGIPHRFVDVGLGHLATETDADGRTAIASVFAVGDGAALGGARVAMARGRIAGLAAARDLGRRCARRSGRARGAGACAAIPGRAVAGVSAAGAARGRACPTRPSCAAARKSPPGGCAPNSRAG